MRTEAAGAVFGDPPEEEAFGKRFLTPHELLG